MPEKTTGALYLDHTFSLRQALGWLGTAFLILLLGAHFFRASEYGLMLCCLGVLILHGGHAAWKRYAVIFFLAWGAFEWGTTAFYLAQSRMQSGQPWVRGSLILWVIAGITCLEAIRLYHQQSRTVCADAYARLKGVVFITSFCAIDYLSSLALSLTSMPLLLLDRFLPRWGDAQVFFMACYAVFVLTLLLDAKHSHTGRKLVWCIFCVVFFGQLALGLLGVDKMLMTGNLHIPVPGFIVFGAIFREVLSIMLVLVFVATLLTGSAWCSMLCYFGPLDLLAAGSKPIKPIPPILQWMIRYGRLCVLAIGIFVAIILRIMEQSLETVLFFSFFFVFASLFTVGMISRKYNSMIHCTAFCPMGIIVNMLGKISLWHIHVDKEICVHCGACENICKYRAISLSSRNKGKTGFSCSLCMDCMTACKKQAISMRTTFIPLSSDVTKRIFIMLLVTVHVVFLSFARV